MDVGRAQRRQRAARTGAPARSAPVVVHTQTCLRACGVSSTCSRVSLRGPAFPPCVLCSPCCSGVRDANQGAPQPVEAPTLLRTRTALLFPSYRRSKTTRRV